MLATLDHAPSAPQSDPFKKIKTRLKSLGLPIGTPVEELREAEKLLRDKIIEVPEGAAPQEKYEAILTWREQEIDYFKLPPNVTLLQIRETSEPYWKRHAVKHGLPAETKPAAVRKIMDEWKKKVGLE